MTTPSAMTSPSSPSIAQPSTTHHDFSDFLTFIGLDPSSASTPHANPTPSADSPNLPEAGPSYSSRRGSMASSTSRGRGRPRSTRGGKAGRATVSDPKPMDSIEGMEGIEGLMGNSAWTNASQGTYDPMQAALQQQLEHIHMQSPLVFDPNIMSGTTSPYQLAAAQMYLTSPNGQPAETMSKHSRQQGIATYGMITPGPSGEMFPQQVGQSEMMSPMQLEMLARGDMADTLDMNMVPLLSPALTHHASTSAYTSPAFAGHSNHPTVSSTASSASTYPSPAFPTDQANRSPLEQLAEQQRQFQEQLVLLQQQQQELQATAAAVAAAQNSPQVFQNRAATTPGLTGTPSEGYFSPLTSPALEATRQSQSFYPRANRQPHPLSALGSPALNPVGYMGGAQQTLSPALAPANDGEMAEPDYLRALVGILDQQQQQSPILPAHPYQSPNLVPHASPSLSTGPHRQSLPAKSRPSPMMKPTTHRSHVRHPSGQFSVPSSPLALAHHSATRVHPPVPQQPGVGYLPPAAIVQQQQTGTSETPSPVDLSQIMPPPPVPPANGTTSQRKAAVQPMTPASLMNLGNGYGEASAMPKAVRRTSSGREVRTATPANGSRKVGVNGTTTTKKAGAAKVVGTSAKRTLAMRPAGVGVRTATKASAAAASSIPEPETRRTSHKAAEQKRRDSLKAGFDELRLLLPPINTEALDPESGEPIPGSSAPRLLPKSSLVPDDNPNRGVSKVALLKFSNEYIEMLKARVDKRDGYIDRLRREVERLRDGGGGGGDEVTTAEGEDLLEWDWAEGEDDEFGPPAEEDEDEGEGVGNGEGQGEEEDGMGEDDDDDVEEGMDIEDDDDGEVSTRRRGGGINKSPALGPKRAGVKTR